VAVAVGIRVLVGVEVAHIVGVFVAVEVGREFEPHAPCTSMSTVISTTNSAASVDVFQVRRAPLRVQLRDGYRPVATVVMHGEVEGVLALERAQQANTPKRLDGFPDTLSHGLVYLVVGGDAGVEQRRRRAREESPREVVLANCQCADRFHYCAPVLTL